MSNSSDSNTFVLRTTVDRVVTSYRLDPVVKEMFKEKVRKQGLSTCHVMEALQYGYVMGSPDKPLINDPNMTINLYLTREVTKRRRTGELETKIAWRGSVDSCGECGDPPLFLGGYRADPFTWVKKYLCETCFRIAQKNKELSFWDRVKVTPYYFEVKESRVSKPKSLLRRFIDWVRSKFV